jgi:hypothetical protein
MALAPQSTVSAPPLPDLPANHCAQAYGGLPARQLLEAVQMAAADIDDPETQVIFTAFYHRYRRYLCTIVKNALGRVYDGDAQNEIVDDALAAFFRASNKLKLPAAKDDATCDLIVRSYLGRLAKWKAGAARSFQQSFGRDVIDEEALAVRLQKIADTGYNGTAIISETDDRPVLSAVELWMSSLSDLESDVIRTYFLDDYPGQKSDRLPDGVALLLAKKYHTTTSNLRHIKSKLETSFREKFREYSED